MTESQLKIGFTFAVVGLLSATVLGLAWMLTSPWEIVGISFAYASGLSMILLPCTLPAVLVIVPLAMGKGPIKGVSMALLFALGMMLTLAVYGVIVAYFGKIFFLDQVTFLMWLIAALAAYLFGLYELGAISLPLPSFSIPGVPRWGDYARSFTFGVLLGNAGIGCPNPAFYVLLTYIAGSAALDTGATLGFVHGFGRVVPLLAIVLLALMGSDVRARFGAARDKLQAVVGWSLIVFALILLPKPLFGHAWWEASVFHEGWQRGVMATLGERIAESGAAEEALASQNIVQPFLGHLVPTHELQIFVPWLFAGVLFCIALVLRRRRLGKSWGGSLGFSGLTIGIAVSLAAAAESIPHTH
jgi:cytochrome c-type biogenesis protein